MAPSGIQSLRLYGLPVSHGTHRASSSSSSSPAPLPSPLATSTSSSSESTSTSEQSFTHPTSPMPPPGPAHYEARRALWLKPPPSPPRAPSPSTSRAKLEALLSQEDAVTNDEVWTAGVRSVWRGLVGGGRLRRRLPLAMVLKILQAGWLRDGTWLGDTIVGPPSPPPIPPIPAPYPDAKGGDGDGEHDNPTMEIDRVVQSLEHG